MTKLESETGFSDTRKGGWAADSCLQNNFKCRWSGSATFKRNLELHNTPDITYKKSQLLNKWLPFHLAGFSKPSLPHYWNLVLMTRLLQYKVWLTSLYTLSFWKLRRSTPNTQSEKMKVNWKANSIFTAAATPEDLSLHSNLFSWSSWWSGKCFFQHNFLACEDILMQSIFFFESNHC